MKKYLVTLLFLLIFSACSSTDCCTNYDTAIDVKFVNSQGENLFDLPNGYSESQIIVYHKVGAQWIQYFVGNLDAPKGILKVELENGTFLRIFPSLTKTGGNFSETKLQFSESDSDIIRTQINKSSGGTFITKVWYNDVLKWESGTERSFEIVK